MILPYLHQRYSRPLDIRPALRPLRSGLGTIITFILKCLSRDNGCLWMQATRWPFPDGSHLASEDKKSMKI